jgi:O-antigen/teichoic acid export membrane protein
MKISKHLSIISDLKRAFISEDSRTVTLKKNIIGSILVKGVSVGASFLTVPLCLNYLDKYQYGIWLTIASFLAWFVLFEIGLGAGLQNKLTEALSTNKIKLARVYVSTSYVAITSIIIVVSLIFYLIQPFINWASVFNVPQSMNGQLRVIILIAFSFFFFQFVFRLIDYVLIADQKVAFANALGPISSVISLVVIFIISRTCKPSLLYLCLAFLGSQLLTTLGASIFFFSTRYKHIRPSIFYFRKNYLSDLMKLGINFFFIKISGIFIFQATMIIIAQYFTPSAVTQYNVADKLFSLVFVGFSYITQPLWPAYTQAWITKDVNWISKTTNKLLKLWFIIIVFTIILLLSSKQIYSIWVGQKLTIPFILSFAIALHYILFLYGGIFNVFINGVGKLKIQLISLILGAMLYIPFVYLFTRILHMGPEGIVFAMIIANFYSFIICPIQFRKIVTGSAKGIWNK